MMRMRGCVCFVHPRVCLALLVLPPALVMCYYGSLLVSYPVYSLLWSRTVALGVEGDVFYSVAKFNQKNRENLTADMKDLMAESTNALVVDVSTQHYAKRYLA